jgi:DNA polymerase I-like protein with 3'-5' exonuclease and polymerase domains
MEIVIESKQEVAERAAKILQDCMEKAGAVFCKVVKLPAEAVISKHWTH